MFTNTRCAVTGQTGVRTFFIIKLTQNQAREITRYSLLPGEDEVLLPPGCQFRVTSVLPQGDLTIIQVEELPSTAWILDLNVAAAAAAPEPAGAGAAQPEPAAADAEMERLRAEVERMRVERDAERRAREEAEARREREAQRAAHLELDGDDYVSEIVESVEVSEAWPGEALNLRNLHGNLAAALLGLVRNADSDTSGQTHA